MSITCGIYTVYEDDPVYADVRVDFYFPGGNGSQWFSTGILVDRGTLPQNYTLSDLADACTAIIDTQGIAVSASPLSP